MPPRPAHWGARTYGLAIRGLWTVENDSLPSISCPDTRRAGTRWTREPRIRPDPPRSAQIRRQLAGKSWRQPRS